MTLETNKTDLLEKIRKYKKIDFQTMCSENFETKDYLKSLHLSDARLRFSLRSKMARTVQMNFKGDPKFKKNSWQCKDCEIPDTQEHILRCPTYEHLRIGKDLNFDKDLVGYFRTIIDIRVKLDDMNP